MRRRTLIAAVWVGAAAGTVGRAVAAQATAPSNWLTQRAGARVVAFSSEFGAGWVAANLAPADDQLRPDGRPVADLVWSSGSNAPFPHWVLLDLGQARWLTQFVFNNALSDEPDHPGISARALELWVGDRAEALRKVAAFELARNQDGQAVAIEPVQVRFVRFTVRSNWGHPWYTELGASVAFDDGRRPGDLASALKTAGRADLYGIYFDFGSATLRAESAPALAQILAFHRAHPQQKLTIEGHTDNVGSEAVNAELSARRAAAVVAELVKQGAAARLLTPVGRGAAQPVAPNTSDAGRALNRRVTVVLS
jgi:outer membrane protein OmpA-like peptidoglycan-associated protein